MNPIKPEDLFSTDFTEKLDAIIAKLETAMNTIIAKMGEVRQSAKSLASTNVGSNAAQGTRQHAAAVQALSDEYKSLLRDYGIYANTLEDVTSVQRDQNQILKLQQQYAEAAEGSFNKLSAEYRLLKVAANALDPSVKENAKNFKYLQERMSELYSTMNKYQQSTGKYSMQVGDYTTALNGLSLSTQQILREMPTLANSTSQFFMAISNNVPIFIDNFKRARQELGSFSAALAGTLRALLSWQTLLLAVLTVLPKLAKAIHDKKKAQQEANKEMAEQIDHLKQIHKAMLAAAQAEEASVVKLNLINSALHDVNRSEEERIRIGGELKELYKEQLENYSEEEIALGKADGLINTITDSLKRQAKARALVNRLTEAYTSQMEAEDRMMAAGTTRLKGGVAGMATVAALSRYMQSNELSAREAKKLLPGVTDEIIKQVEAYRAAQKETKEYGATIEGLSKEIDVLALFDANKSGSGGGGGGTTKQKEVGAIPDFIIEYYEALIAGMEDGLTKQSLQLDKEGLELGREREKIWADLAKKEAIARANGDKKALADIAAAYERYAMVYEQGMENIRKRRAALFEGEAAEGLIDPLAEVRKAYYDALVAQRDYTKQIQKGLDEGRTIGQEELKGWQEAIKKRIEAEAEFQKAKKILELQGMLDAKKITQQEYEQRVGIVVEEIDAATRKAIDKIGKKKSKKWNLWTALFGTDVKDETTGTISRILGEDVKYALDQTMSAYKQATSYVNEYIDALARQAQQAIETANTEIDLARKVLETELEARAQGYANSVDLARKEYEERIAIQKKAQQEAEKINRLQMAMESATQAANLVTATTSIIKAYSALPLAGQILAIGAIAAMWGTFAAAKIKAAQVTKYGEGMSEYLDYGGSHASGKDIDFGVGRDGRRRRVERGEVIGVIRKRNVQKYGASTVTGIIDSLNRGDFEYKYGNAYPTPILAAAGTNLSHLESGVDKLVEQGNYRETMAGGKRIIQYKNLTRTVRQ